MTSPLAKEFVIPRASGVVLIPSGDGLGSSLARGFLISMGGRRGITLPLVGIVGSLLARGFVISRGHRNHSVFLPSDMSCNRIENKKQEGEETNF